MVNYPLAILAVCLMILAPLAVVGARASSNYSQLADLDPDRPSVVGASLVQLYFAVGELGPTEALLENSGSGFPIAARQSRDRGNQQAVGGDGSVAEIRSPDPAPG